ncbi:MAG: hypothetical protein ACFHW5_03570 [Verrucomicrobiota bacterium]|jgi:hypothetical protein
MKRKVNQYVVVSTTLVICLIGVFYLNKVGFEFASGREAGSTIELSDNQIQPQSKSSYKKLMEPSLLSEKEKLLEEQRLQSWKENFPWQPTHDAKVIYDPLRPYQFLNGVDATDFTDQQRDDLSAFWKHQSNSEMAAGVNHSFLKKFFQDKNRFTPQFEKFCRILKDHERGHNPVMTGSCFWALRQYYHAAYEHEPSEYIQRNGKRIRKGLFGYVTWGDKSNELYESLRGWLRHWEWLNPKFGTDAGKAEANALIKRLVTEIQGLENLPLDVMAYGTGMSDQSPDYQSIRNGEEEMLVPYVGWFEQSQVYEGIQNRQFEMDFKQGDPSLKEAAPELFPPVDIKNGQLVDKDDNPVKWSESRQMALINERGERIPVIVEDDGSVSLPTPEEVELMRQRGDIRPATMEEAAPIIQSIMEMEQPAQ